MVCLAVLIQQFALSVKQHVLKNSTPSKPWNLLVLGRLREGFLPAPCVGWGSSWVTAPSSWTAALCHAWCAEWEKGFNLPYCDCSAPSFWWGWFICFYEHFWKCIGNVKFSGALAVRIGQRIYDLSPEQGSIVSPFVGISWNLLSPMVYYKTW